MTRTEFVGSSAIPSALIPKSVTEGYASRRMTTGRASIRARSLAAAGDHVRLVPEPESAVFAQDLGGGFDVACVIRDLCQAFVLDLVHVDRCIPGGPRGRGSNRAFDLRWQRVH